jgi:4-carboxymuconolactone decarboxylase
VARIKPADPKFNGLLEEAYDQITRTRGYVSNILMSLSNAPEGLKRFAAMGEYVRYMTEIPGRTRELVILSVARGNEYAWLHHYPHAVKAGVSEEELAALEANRTAPSLSAAEVAAMSYAQKFATGGVTDAIYAGLEEHYSPRQITDITLMAGYFLALGSMINAFRIDLEPAFVPKNSSAK